MRPIPAEWQAALERLAKEARVVMLLGSVDVGKTTFCEALAAAGVSAGRRVAVLDADIGQSEIGPPGCIGLAMPTQVPFRLQDLKPVGLYFVGSTTPIGFMVECVAGVRRLATRAASLGAELTVVDTTGLVHGHLGRKLKAGKVDVLAPDAVVVLQRAGEAEHVVRTCPPSRLVRLPVPEQIRPKPTQMRSLRRSSRLAAYFRDARDIELPLRRLIRRGARFLTGQVLEPVQLQALSRGLSVPVLHGEENRDGYYLITRGVASEDDSKRLAERLNSDAVQIVNVGRMMGVAVGLLDANADTLAMGILRNIDFASLHLRVLTPWLDPTSLHGVSFGVMRLQPDGSELEPLRSREI